MRLFASLYFAFAVAAKSPVGDFDGDSGRFLASLSRHGVATSSASGGVGEYERETQSPMVWLNLHKSKLDVKSSSIAHADAAAQGFF